MRSLLLIVPLVLANPAHAARVEPAEPGLGQRATLHLERAPADSTQWPVATNAALRPTEDPRVFEFVPLRVGELAIALPATGDTLRLNVPATIEDPRPETLRPLHSVGDISPRWGATILLGLGILALLGGLLAWWLLSRGRRMVVRPAPPPEPPHVVALRELDRLERARLIADGRFEDFYVRGSHILREYAGRRYRVPVLDWTTTETLDALRGHEEAADHLATVAPLLTAADEVKFARHRPAPEDGASWLRRAREYVELTTRRPVVAGDDPGSGRPDGMAEVSA